MVGYVQLRIPCFIINYRKEVTKRIAIMCSSIKELALQSVFQSDIRGKQVCDVSYTPTSIVSKKSNPK